MNNRRIFNNLKRSIKRLKYWFNKLFVPIVPIIVSVSSVFVAMRANAIFEAQREIEKQAAAPFIDVVSHYDEEGKVTKVEIVNSGGLLDEIDIVFYPYVYYHLRSINYEKIDTNDLSVKDEYGICPINIKREQNNKDSLENKLFDNKVTLFKILAPHTKIGSLFEIRNTDYMNYFASLMEEMDGVIWLKWLVQKDGRLSILDKPSVYENTIITFFTAISFEYMVKINYSSLVDDEHKTELFRVATGIGAINIRDGNRITPGVTIVKDETLEMDIYQTISTNIEKDAENERYLCIEGIDEAIKTDTDKLIDYLLANYVDGNHFLHHANQ